MIDEEATSRFASYQEDGKELKLHYNEFGAGDETVIMLHGSGPGTTGVANFNRNIDPFVAAGYRVLLIDFPGWGKSDSIVSTGSRSELNARALLGLMDGIGLERAHLIGNSMGAHSAVAFTLAHPDRTGKMVLMGGGASGPSLFTPMPAEGIKLIGAVYREPSLENLQRMMNVFVYDPSALPPDMLEGRLAAMKARPDHLENNVKSTHANAKQFPDLSHRLGEISAQTLVVWGRDDRFMPMDLSLRLLWGLKNVELHIFDKCGHWAQWEHADKFNRLALQFFKED